MFHLLATAADHQEMDMVGQAVNQGSRHLFIGKDAAPYREPQVCRQDETLVLVSV